MQRRHFLQAFAALTATSSIPALADSGEGLAFDAAVASAPELLPFKGVTDATGDRRCDALELDGHWPAALRGRFYRNGPALNERDGQRYHHWFAGDGMVQQFSFSGGARPQVRHVGRLVRTAKLEAERKAGKFLYSAYGTRVEGDAPSQGPDTYNVANTNALEHAGRVLAMWEGGSAYALRPDDLSTLGPVTWQEGLAQMPFSAHPKLDAAGHLWNFGSAGANLVVWHVDPAGRLVRAQTGESPYPGGMAHDAAITAQYIVLPLPPIKLHFGEDIASGHAFTYEPDQPLRILVMRKGDIGQRRVFELPAQMVFHVGNAHERSDGSIVLSYAGSKTPEFAVHGASLMLAGERAAPAHTSTQVAHLDMRTGRATVEDLGDAMEFPRVHPLLNGQDARYLLSAAAWDGATQGGSLFRGVQLRDLHTGRLARYDYGAQTIAEEHILVPKPGRRGELDAWILGTTYDVARRVTRVNLLEATHLGGGPVATATLPYGLPYGFHGNYTAA